MQRGSSVKISIVYLKLLCRGSEELITFGPKISFFHGRMSSGKSTIVEMINFCLGGRLVKTPAVSSEVLKAQLTVRLGDTEVLIERAISASNVEVSWEQDGHVFREVLPLQAGERAIIGDDVFNLSDFLLVRMGSAPMKVRKRKADEDSELHRLSFRDFYRFCYLDQPHLDSSLFALEQPIKAEKSKDVLKFVLGFQSDVLTQLQQELQEKRQEQRSLREAAKQIREFLNTYGFASEASIDSQVDEINGLTEKLEIERAAQEAPTEFVEDSLRNEAVRLAEAYQLKAAAIEDIRLRQEEQEALRSELITLKMKAARAVSASKLLQGATFKACPCCGTSVTTKSPPGHCYLCKAETDSDDEGDMPSSAVEQDLSDRIDDLDISLRRLSNSLRNQSRSLSEIQAKRAEISHSIDSARQSVESQYLQRARQIESELGKLNERRRFLMHVRAMPADIEARMASADELSADIAKIMRNISEEEEKFEKGRIHVKALQENFKSILRAIKFPEIGDTDGIHINTRTWFPYIYPEGNFDAAWTFYDVGSGGKAVLFKISYALAIHKTAAEQGLPIPQLLIVDSTMKNITPDINPLVFKNFYKELYRLLNAELIDWQCIIVDQTFSPFEGFKTGTFERKMVVDDPEHPPLISYYRGH